MQRDNKRSRPGTIEVFIGGIAILLACWASLSPRYFPNIPTTPHNAVLVEPLHGLHEAAERSDHQPVLRQ
jgi:hypothetical protein